MWNTVNNRIPTVRELQVRVNSLNILKQLKLEPLVVDGIDGPKTRHALKMVKEYFGFGMDEEILDTQGITRVHWHWTAGHHEVSEFDRSHYNILINGDGSRVDGGAPPEQQAHYIPGKVGVSHTYNANTGAVGVAMGCMAGATESGGVVDMGSSPMNWVQVDSMLEVTAALCKQFNIVPSPETCLSHAEVQGTLGIRQRNKWDIRVLPDHPTKLIPAREAGDILRKRMIDKYWV